MTEPPHGFIQAHEGDSRDDDVGSAGRCRGVGVKGEDAGPATVLVLGEVRTPQQVNYAAAMTVSSAIGAAGGVSDFGATRVYLIRDGSVVLQSNTKKVFEQGGKDNWPLKPRDVVYCGPIHNMM